uniref:Dynein heavy chain tail domain-containing protein n=1 Tax=Myripristis murdjan TaxID=586833 RepID=A0A667Y8J8_9TELE
MSPCVPSMRTDQSRHSLRGVTCEACSSKQKQTENELQASNIIYFSMLDATDGILKGTCNLLSKFLLPSLNAAQDWGGINKSQHGEKLKQNFKDTLKRSITFLDSKSRFLQVDVNNQSTLLRYSITVNDITTSEHGSASSHNNVINQLSYVLTESDQVRREADSAGPLTELEFWKRKSVKFNSIINHIRSPECQAVVMVLFVNGSKTLKMWRKLDAQITERTNEAKDNAKFLGALEEACQPLYNSDPCTMAKSVQHLISVIQMIHSVSRYYYTCKNITRLFAKVTNQMLTACRAHITDNGTRQIWDQDAEDVIKKIQVWVTRREINTYPV